MFKIVQKGTFGDLTDFLKDCLEIIDEELLNKYGEIGVRALEQATPRDTGETAFSWYYTIKREKGRTSLEFNNRHMMDEVSVAIILQYGHATKSGTWVEGREYINSALQVVFDDLAYKMWEEVVK